MIGAAVNASAARTNWKLPALAAAATLAGFFGVLVIGRPANRQATPPPVQPPVEHAVAVEQLPRDSTETPTWVGLRRASWARDGSKTISFELQADKDLPVWMDRVLPVLVVRCLSRRTEVFVVTGATSIESTADRHTVRIHVDEGAEEVQEWFGSESSHELFAPDGMALARRLARAHIMRFSFTPFNASPVVAEFYVAGFDEDVGLVASTCGWRADAVTGRQTRRATVK